MNIDFSFSIQDWLDMFNQFFAIFENFFRRIGFQLFEDDKAEPTTKA